MVLDLALDRVIKFALRVIKYAPRVMLQIVALLTIIIYVCNVFIVQAIELIKWLQCHVQISIIRQQCNEFLGPIL
jgi:hypothetical protein